MKTLLIALLVTWGSVDEAGVPVDGGTFSGDVAIDSGYHLSLPSDNDAATPTLSFNGDTGFYEIGADNLGISIGTNLRFDFLSNIFRASAASGPAMYSRASTATVPVFVPVKSSTTTGWGGVADTLSGIIAGAEIAQINATQLLLQSTTDLVLADGDAVFGDDDGPVFGAGTDAAMFWNTSQTNHALTIGTDATSRTIWVAEYADLSSDLGLANQGNPTLAIGSNNVAVDTSEYVAMYHDETNARITVGSGIITFDTYTRHHDVAIGAATNGVTAPSRVTIGTYRCAEMDAAAEELFFNVEVPGDWVGSSDMTLRLIAFTESGDALGNTEVIEFDAEYRSTAEGEAYDNGTAVTISPSVTGGAAEPDKGQYHIEAVIDWDDANQTLAADDTLGFVINRDVAASDTYSGAVYVCRAEVAYEANRLGVH